MKIESYLKDKRVCLLGNAQSILQKENPIDTYDVVCRCNRGFPWGKEKFIGSKTDILFTSYAVNPTDLKKLAPRYIVWCTPRHEKMTPEFADEVDMVFAMKDWINLERELGSRPSTGCMAIYWLMNHAPFKSLDVYGFDFWKSNTWWEPRTAPIPHNPEAEKKYIEWLEDKNSCLTIMR